jgi:flagellar biosynthesis protein FlhF
MGLASRRLVLIDTPGISPRDERLTAQLATLLAPGCRRRGPLVLTARRNGERSSSTDRALVRAARPEAVLLTKLDEAASLGPALSVADALAAAARHLCDGPRVPEDIERARPHQLVARA